MKIYFTNEFMNNKGESHELLALAIADYTGCDAAPYIDRMEIGELGKPAIAGLDDFSISHSRNVWAVLFDSNPCGLDVQEHRDVIMDRIAKKWFHEEEVKLLDETEEDVKSATFYRIWARREALVKSVGTSIVNRHLPSTIQGRALTADVHLEGQQWKIMDVTIPGAEDMSAAVCCKELADIEFIDIGGCDAG